MERRGGRLVGCAALAHTGQALIRRKPFAVPRPLIIIVMSNAPRTLPQGLVNKLTDYGVQEGNILGIKYGVR